MPFAITGVSMYLQSRTRRWLQTLRNANTQLHSAVGAVAAFEAARAQGARVLGEQEHRVMTVLARDYIDLTLESQPLTPGSWLETPFAMSFRRESSSPTAISSTTASTR